MDIAKDKMTSDMSIEMIIDLMLTPIVLLQMCYNMLELVSGFIILQTYSILVSFTILLLWQMLANNINSQFKPSKGLGYVKDTLEYCWEMLGLWVGKLLNAYEWYLMLKDVFEPVATALMELMSPIAYIILSWVKFFKGFCMQKVHIITAVPYILGHMLVWHGQEYIPQGYHYFVLIMIDVLLFALLFTNSVNNGVYIITNYIKYCKKRDRLHSTIVHTRKQDIPSLARKYGAQCENGREMLSWLRTKGDIMLRDEFNIPHDILLSMIEEIIFTFTPFVRPEVSE